MKHIYCEGGHGHCMQPLVKKLLTDTTYILCGVSQFNDKDINLHVCSSFRNRKIDIIPVAGTSNVYISAASSSGGEYTYICTLWSCLLSIDTSGTCKCFSF